MTKTRIALVTVLLMVLSLSAVNDPPSLHLQDQQRTGSTAVGVFDYLVRANFNSFGTD